MSTPRFTSALALALTPMLALGTAGPRANAQDAPAAAPAAPQNAPAAGPAAPVAPIPIMAPPAAPQDAGGYTLEECLRAALNDRSLTKRQTLTLDQAQSQKDLAKANLGPTFSSVAIAKTRTNSNIQDTSGDQFSFLGEKFRAGITVSYPLYDSGVRRTQVQLADLNIQSTRQSQQAENKTVVANTINAYYDVLQGQRFLETANRQVTETQAHLSDVNQRLQVGTVTRGDSLQAQSALETAQAALSQRKYALATAQSQLALLMGLDPVHARPTVQAPPPITLNLPQGDITQKALANAPELDRLKTQEKIAEKQLTLIKEQHGPTITAVAGVGVADRANSLTDSRNSTRGYAFIGVNAVIPLFDSAEQRAKERVQKDTIALSRLRTTDYSDQFSSAVALTREGYESSQAAVDAATQAVSTAEEAHRLAAERYAVGKGTQFEVLEALDRLEAARDQLALEEGNRDKLALNLRMLLERGPASPGSDDTDRSPNSHDSAPGKG